MKEKNINFWELLITFVFNLVLAGIGFYALDRFAMPLWGQIFVGILTFEFVLCVVKIGLSFVLAAIAVAVIWLEMGRDDGNGLHNIHILDDKEDDDETL